MKKNAFTLVELLAVIAILTIIMVISVPQLITSIKNKKTDALEKTKDLLISAARNYVIDYELKVPTSISIETLCKNDYLECPIKNPIDNSNLNGYVNVDDNVAKNYIQPAVREIAEELNLVCVDLYNPLKGHPEFMPGGNDWVHPDHRGHYIIAKEVYKAITGEFVMNPGGITVAASDISLSGSKAKMKNGAIEKAKNGTRLSFDVHFGSLPTYEKVEVDVQLNKKKSGYLDFYLDTETIPFASVDVSGADSKNFTTQSALFDRRIKGKHKVTVQWRGQDAKLKSVTIKEKYMPYVTDNVSQVYLVNKATGMVLDCNPDSKVISAAKYDSEKKSQLFCIENLTYHILRVRNIATNLHVMNNGDKVIVGKPGDDWRVHDPKYALFLTPTDDEGYYSLGLSPEARIGLSSANSTEVVGNRSGQIEDLDKWKIVTADEMKKQ